MDITLACRLVEYEMENFPCLVDEGWIVTTGRMKRTFGKCFYQSKRIVLSEHFIRLNPPERVKMTGLHEIAHALVGPHVPSHGRIWKAQAIELGIPPFSCSGVAKMPEGKWVAVCPGCQRIFYKYRNPGNRRRYCQKCGPEQGNLVFIPNVAEAEDFRVVIPRRFQS